MNLDKDMGCPEVVCGISQSLKANGWKVPGLSHFLPNYFKSSIILPFGFARAQFL
jgi:hypothetical protein